VRSPDEQRFLPGLRSGLDPQSELVRRYARILRSAPAEAGRARTPGGSRGPRFARAAVSAPPGRSARDA
jgi:hypothetical protein